MAMNNHSNAITIVDGKAKIALARDFSRHPAGRYLSDGPASGQRFREEHLVPALNTGFPVEVDLDGTRGYGSSFLEEAFGGLVRVEGFSRDDLDRRLTFRSTDPSVPHEIREYLAEATPAPDMTRETSKALA